MMTGDILILFTQQQMRFIKNNHNHAKTIDHVETVQGITSIIQISKNVQQHDNLYKK